MPTLRVMPDLSAWPRRALAVGFLSLLCLQACATPKAGDTEPDGPVVGTYLDPLVRGGILEAAKYSDTEFGPSEGTDAAPTEDARLEDLTPGYRPPLEGDEANLWVAATGLEAKLSASGSLIDDPALTAYLQDIVCSLAKSHCEDVRVYVVSGAGFYASMAPNGVMQVWTGTLWRLRSEAELAAVIGHELGHYLRRHSLQRFRSAKTKLEDWKQGIEDFRTGRGDFAAIGVGLLSLLGEISRFSRFHEREADGYALRLLAEANYDPSAVPELWRRVNEEFETSEAYRNQSVFFASHPLMKERSQVLSVLAREVKSRMKSRRRAATRRR